MGPLERYRGSEHEHELQKLLLESTHIPDTKSEFGAAMDKIKEKLDARNRGQEMQVLLQQYKQGTLSAENETRMRELLRPQKTS